MLSHVLNELEENGYKAAVVSVDRLLELKQDIERSCLPENMSDKFAGFLQHCFDFNLPESLSDAKSIIVAAAPSPRGKMVFHHNGANVPVQIPPSYVDMFSGYERIHEALKKGRWCDGLQGSRSEAARKASGGPQRVGGLWKKQYLLCPWLRKLSKTSRLLLRHSMPGGSLA